MNDYRQRNETLRRLGLGDYRSYLDSELWRSIRTRVMKRDRFKCCVCRSKFYCVHHHDYDPATLLGKSIDRLFSLCEEHHRSVEFRPNGGKRSFVEVRSELRKLLGESMPVERLSVKEIRREKRLDNRRRRKEKRAARREKIEADPVAMEQEKQRMRNQSERKAEKNNLIDAEAERIFRLPKAEAFAELSAMSKQKAGRVRSRMRAIRKRLQVPHGQQGDSTPSPR